jgi:predicted acetyltransferase
MTIAITGVTESEWQEFHRVDQLAFGYDATEEEDALDRELLEQDRMIAAHADSQLVGVGAAFSLDMTMPGGGVAPVAGVTWVAVLPTHRRRGILTAMMRYQLHGLHQSGGEAVAALTASEPVIYGRFGYGLASLDLHLTMHRGANAVRRSSAPDGSFTLRLCDPTEILPSLSPVYEAERAARPGMLARDERWWRLTTFFPEHRRDGASSLRTVILSDGAGLRGYANFAIKDNWTDGRPASEVRVREMFATDPAAYAGIWRFLLDIDLTATVEARSRPVDDPLLHLLTDPRGARPTLMDALYVRLVDVDRALSQRTYDAPVDVVVDVSDDFCPWNAGRWRLSGDPSGATCTRTRDAADVTLSATELGAAYLGGTSIRALARAGRVHEETRGAVAAVDRAFRSEPLPWCPVRF